MSIAENLKGVFLICRQKCTPSQNFARIAEVKLEEAMGILDSKSMNEYAGKRKKDVKTPCYDYSMIYHALFDSCILVYRDAN